jgi:16S rRNA (uracil1498-N3)-methyltransferase
LQRITIEPHQIQAGQLLLTREQEHYLQRVLRLTPGDQFQAIDGQGALYLATLHSAGVQIIPELNVINRELPLAIHLVLAIPKTGLDDVIRACTELGVREIHPVTSDRTVPKPGQLKQQRWQKIAQEAAEQCERLMIPTIHDLQPWQQIAPPGTDQKFICATRITAPHFIKCDISTTPLWLAIGPEGGWTDRELEQASHQHWQPVSLGARILRSITAPVVAMSIVSSKLEVLTP